MLSRQEIKERAKTNFKANYWPCVGWLLLGGIIAGTVTSGFNFNSFNNLSNSGNTGNFSGAVGARPEFWMIFWAVMAVMIVVMIAVLAIRIFVGTIAEAGIGFFSLKSYNGEKAGGKDLFSGFKKYTHVLG